MKKLINIVFILLIFLAYSCDDKLDVINPNEQTSADYWQTDDEVAEGLIATYNRLILDGSYKRMTPNLNDVRGDDTWSECSWTIYPLTGDFTVQSSYDVMLWPWRDFYQDVNRANMVIQYAENVDWDDADYKARVVGQAKFLRAFGYWNLVTQYQQVPLVLTVQETSDDYYPSTADSASVYDQIKYDLRQAVDELPVDYDDVSGDDAGQTGRATRGAAEGLLAKVYLYQNMLDSAGYYLNDIINSGTFSYSLMSNFGDNFTYSNENNAESLFEVQFGNYGTTISWLGASTTSWNQGAAIAHSFGCTDFGGYEDLQPTDWIVNEFKKETTTTGGIDPRLYWSVASYESSYDTDDNDYTDNVVYSDDSYLETTYESDNTDKFVCKYTYARIDGETVESNNELGTSEINYRILRYSDILLMYSEVLARQSGVTAAALTPLNEVRNRADLKTLTVDDFTSSDDLLDEIYHQRALEFAFEGNRIYDIKRLGWLYDSDKLAELESHDDEFDTWTAGHEYFPIPSDELDANPNLSTNDAN